MCGRRWGKTRGAIQRLVEKNLMRQAGSLAWWVSPTYRQAKIAFRYYLKIFKRWGIIKNLNRQDLVIEHPGGRRLEFRSAEIPDNLRGEGVDDLVVDECGMIHEEVWVEILRPALMDTEGTADLIGTPKGRNWFDVAYQLGLSWSPQQGDIKSFRFSSYDNPYIKKAEIDKVVEGLPDIAVRQEIFAEPMENEGVVFRNVDDLAWAVSENPRPGMRYFFGIDLAKYRDFTVIIGRDETGRMVYFDRFNKIDWAVQKRRIIDVLLRYNKATGFIDSTGIGDPIYEDLRRAGLDVISYQLNSTSKKELIDNLVLKFDKRELEIIREPILVAELKAYAYEVTASGNLKTNAPSGQHDDCVIALALCFANTIAMRHEGLLEYYRQEAKKIEDAKKAEAKKKATTTGMPWNAKS